MKKCEILGFTKYADKDTGELKIVILYGIASDNENYIGLKIPKNPVFLDYTDDLFDNLKNAYENKNKVNVYYKSTDNVITGTTKIVDFEFKLIEQE